MRALWPPRRTRAIRSRGGHASPEQKAKLRTFTIGYDVVKCLSIAIVLVACDGSSGTTPDAPVVDARPDAPAARHIGMLAIIEGNLVNGTSTAVFGAFGVDNLSTVLSRDDGPCHIEQTTTQGSTVLDDAGTVTVSGESSGDKGADRLPDRRAEYQPVQL